MRGRLNVYSQSAEADKEFVKKNMPYDSAELSQVMDNNDVVVVPSLWRETFSLLVLEAISYGVPVIVSQNVGAKILLEQYEQIGQIIGDDFENELYNCLKRIVKDRSILQNWNKNICNANISFSFSEHTKKIISRCYVGDFDDE